MNTRLIVAALTVAFAVTSSLTTTPLSACSIPDVKTLAEDAQNGTSRATAFLVPEARTSEATPTPDNIRFVPRDLIVGLWKFSVTSQGNSALGIPDGAPLDFGFQTWHSDGTELTNSGMRPPVTGNFCQGVWKEGSDGTIYLNHWGLSWTFDTSTAVSSYQGPGNIHEQLKIDRTGSIVTGTFAVDQYEPDGVTLIVHLTGTVAGTRVPD